MRRKKYAIDCSVLPACLSLFACGGGSNGNGAANPSPSADESIFLGKTVSLPKGDKCDQGGFEIASGEDNNKNGELEDNQVLEKNIVCNGKGSFPNNENLPFFESKEVFAGEEIACQSYGKEKSKGVSSGYQESRYCNGILVNGLPLVVKYATAIRTSKPRLCEQFGFSFTDICLFGL